MWVPSHEGVAPNAYADAVAKGALTAQNETSLTEGVAGHVWSRPCIYERDRGVGEGWELWDRPTFRGARQQADEWVRERLAGRLRPGRITCGIEKPWTTLLAIVGKGKVPKADEPPESDPEVAARIALQRNIDTGLVMGVRADDVRGVRHGATWSRHRLAEGNKGGEYARDGANGCAACLAASWRQVGQERRRRHGRRATVPADRTVTLDRLATQNPFAPLLAQGEQETVHMETLRHVITQCKATSANREMAVGMQRECLQAKAEMSTDTGLAPARAFMQQAADGWAAVQQGQAVSLPT